MAIRTRSPQWRHVSINEMLKSFDYSLESLDQAIEVPRLRTDLILITGSSLPLVMLAA